jgi:hypothetical protein
MNCRPSKCSSESSLVLNDHPQCRYGASDRPVIRAALHGWPPVSSVALKQVASCRTALPSMRPVTTCRRSRRLRGEPRRIAGDSWGIPFDSRLRILLAVRQLIFRVITHFINVPKSDLLKLSGWLFLWTTIITEWEFRVLFASFRPRNGDFGQIIQISDPPFRAVVGQNSIFCDHHPLQFV